jgi:hypothetical protein
MIYDLMYRRGFLITLGSLPLMMRFSRNATAVGDEAEVTLSFFVAGARFQPAVTGLQLGAHVSLVPDLFYEKTRYTVVTEAGQVIGYVPAKIVPLVHGTEIRSSRLSVVDYDAVPWKRFRVAIER